MAGRDVFIAGSIGPVGELEVFDPGRARAALRRAGADPRGTRRRPVHGRDVLRSRRSRGCGRGRARRLVAADRGAPDVRRGGRARRWARRRPRRRSGWRRSTSPRSGRTTEPGRATRSRRSAELQGAGLPLAALPNVGLASLAGGRIVYPHSTPEYFGEFAAQAVALGARLVGGCCGTTPAQIAAIREAVDANRPPRETLRGEQAELVAVPAGLGERDRTSRGRCARASGSSRSSSIRQRAARSRGSSTVTRRLRDSGLVGFVDVNDNPMARARMNALVASAALQREVGIETIPHVTPRDLTVMGLEGLLLGAHAEGREKRSRGHGRSAARRRLSGSTRGVRDRLDRARPARLRRSTGGRTTSGRRSTRRPRSSAASR